MWVAKLEWDPGDSIEMSAAGVAFMSYKAKGYLAFLSGSEEVLNPQTFDGTLGCIEFHTRRSRYDKMMEDDDDE